MLFHKPLALEHMLYYDTGMVKATSLVIITYYSKCNSVASRTSQSYSRSMPTSK